MADFHLYVAVAVLPAPLDDPDDGPMGFVFDSPDEVKQSMHTWRVREQYPEATWHGLHGVIRAADYDDALLRVQTEVLNTDGATLPEWGEPFDLT